MTGGSPHPINCVSCHVNPQRDGFVANLLNEDYLTPLNADVSPDGSKLYVIAQDADLLVVVDPFENEVEKTIEVGRRPHSVEISKDGKTAFVSNQWANNVIFIDLEKDQIRESS